MPHKRAWFAMAVLASVAACHREEAYDGQPIAYWYSALTDTAPAVRAHAADVVSHAAAEHPETIRRLLAAIQVESDTAVHVVLASAIGEAVSKSGLSPAVTSALTRLTTDEHEDVRKAAAIALARGVVASPEDVPIDPIVASAYLSMFRAPDDETRAVAAEAVGAIARTHPTSVATFARPLADLARHDRVLIVRLKALEAFANLASPDSVATSVYASALRDGWPDMATTTLRGLSRAPSVAAGLVDSVLPLLSNDDVVTRVLAVRALEAATRAKTQSNAVAALRRAAADKDSSVSSAASLALKGVARP